MRKILNVALAGILMFGLLACEQRTDRTDGGGVLLTFGQIDWSAIYSVSASVAGGGAHDRDRDAGLGGQGPQRRNQLADGRRAAVVRGQLPARRHRHPGAAGPGQDLPGVIPVNGTATISGMFFMLDGQLENPPLSDLLAVNGGIDRETGAESILLDVSIVFFGRTLSGDEVQSAPLRKTVQFGR